MDEQVTSARAVLSAALVAAAGRLSQHDAGLRTATDPEDIHQARVAVRRYRSVLRTFRPVLDRDWADGLRDDAKAFTKALGRARDIDVMDERLRTRIAALPKERAARLAGVLAELDRIRAESRSRVANVIGDPAYPKLLDELRTQAQNPRFAPKKPDLPGTDLIPHARKEWKRLRSFVEDLDGEPGPKELHRVRILTKRVRYSANALAPVVGKPAERFSKAAAALQDALGEHQDAVVAAAWLGSRLSEAPNAEAAEIKKLVRSEERAADKIRTRWREDWEALGRKRNVAWMKT